MKQETAMLGIGKTCSHCTLGSIYSTGFQPHRLQLSSLWKYGAIVKPRVTSNFSTFDGKSPVLDKCYKSSIQPFVLVPYLECPCIVYTCKVVFRNIDYELASGFVYEPWQAWRMMQVRSRGIPYDVAGFQQKNFIPC